MPLDSAGKRTDPGRRKPKLKKTVNVRPPDRQDPVTSPVVKERIYAHPQRAEPQKVFKRIAKKDARARQQRTVKRERAAALKKEVGGIKVTPVPSPDARDSSRSPAQLQHDAAVVKKNVRDSRLKANAKAGRGSGVRATKDYWYEIATGKPRNPTVKERAAQAAIDNDPKRIAHKAEIAGKIAPVLKVLEQTTRPLHAVAGATDAAVQGKNVPKAALRGIQNKDKTTFSNVLEHAGVKNKLVRAVAGTGLDIALDPTTYVTGGTASVASKTALKAGAKAETKAAAKGLSKEQVKRFGDRARAQAEKTADKTTGVTVKVGGHEVPGVRKATAVASKPVRAAGRKAAPERVRAAVRNVAADVNPNVTPAGVSRETSRKAIQATRTARSKTNQGKREAEHLAYGVRKQIGEKNYNQVVDAIEAGKIGSLPEALRGHAVTLRSQARHVRRVQRRAGIPVADATQGKTVKGYVYRQLTDDAVAADAKAATKRGGLKPPSSKKRVEKRPMSVVRIEKPGRYREDLHALAGERHEQGTRAAAKAGLNRDLADLGTPIKRGHVPTVKDGEAVFHIKEGKPPREVTDRAELARATAPLRLKKVKDPDVLYHVSRHGLSKAGHETASFEVHLGTKKAAKDRAKALKSAKAHVTETLKLPRDATVPKGAEKGSRDNPFTEAELGTLPPAMLAAAKVSPWRYQQAVRELREKGLDAVYYRNEVEHPGSVSILALDRRKLLPASEHKVKVKNATPRKSVGGGRYVVLSKDIVKRAEEGAAPELAGKGVIRGYDKATSGFKRLALATPGFHLRNLIGDTAQAYVMQPGHKLPGNLARAGRVLKAAGRDEKAQRQLGRATEGKGHLKTQRYGKVSYEEAARQLIKHGAARSGYTARELSELSTSGGVKKGGKLTAARKNTGNTKPGQFSKRAFLNREDLPRLATAIAAVQKGATWEEAATKVADTHFDYAHLTSFERNVARRIAPFYTWTARNIPFTTKNIIARPGKYANYQKVREEASKLTQPGQVDAETKDMYAQLEKSGVKMKGGWEKYLTSYEQRNAGVPVNWKGHKFTVSMGLPLQDLNELPGAAGGGMNQLGEWANKAASLVNPIPKDIAEYSLNYSFFFRDQIERDNSPLVAAPSPVGAFSESMKKKLGVVKGRDKRSGKMVWMWPGKVDYIAHTPPGLVNQALKMMTPGHDRQGKGFGAKALGVAGVKATPVDATSNAVNLAYARQQEIQKKLAGLRQTNNPANAEPIGAKNPTPEYTRLNEQLKITTRIAYQGKAKRGDKVLPTQGGPPKLKKPAGFKFDGGAQDFDFGAGASDFDFG